MKSIQIQIQPELSNAVNPEEVVSSLKGNGYFPQVTEGTDEGKYINILVSSSNTAELWKTIKSILNKSKELKSSSIVICEETES